MLGIQIVATRFGIFASLVVVLALGVCASANALSLGGGDRKAINETTLASKSIAIQQSCTYIYPADVNQQTYNIMAPGRYCLAGDLNATIPATSTSNPYGSVSSTPIFGSPTLVNQSTPSHTGAAIHIHVGGVEIDFRGFTLTEHKKYTVDAGVRMKPGISGISIHGGSITGFESGIDTHSDVQDSLPPITNLTIQEMTISGANTGVVLTHFSDSVITRNSFEGRAWGLGMMGLDGVDVTQNQFHLPSTTYWGVGIYTSGPVIDVLIADNTFYGYGYPDKMGIHLHNNSHHANATPGLLSRDNRVERNVMYGLAEPIYVGGSGIASRNIVRDNLIFGTYPENVNRSYPADFPTQFTAIEIENNLDAEIVANYIFSGGSLPYYNGIELTGATTIKRDADDNPRLIHNSTCGVFDPLVPPPGVAESSVDGGNYWNLFCIPPVIK